NTNAGAGAEKRRDAGVLVGQESPRRPRKATGHLAPRRPGLRHETCKLDQERCLTQGSRSVPGDTPPLSPDSAAVVEGARVVLEDARHAVRRAQEAVAELHAVRARSADLLDGRMRRRGSTRPNTEFLWG